MQTLSEDEVRLLFVATQGQELHALWVLLVSSGLRLGEALGLKWEDIDFEQCGLWCAALYRDRRKAALYWSSPRRRAAGAPSICRKGRAPS